MDPISAQDVALALTSGFAIHEDAVTTKAFVKRGGMETNPIFGTPSPTGASVDTAEVVADALVGVTAAVLPEKWRAPVLAGVTAFEGTIAAQNQTVNKDTPKKSFGEVIAAPAISAAAAALAAHLLGNSSVYIEPMGNNGIGLAYRGTF